MKKGIILTVVVTLAIVVGIVAALTPVFAAPTIIIDDKPNLEPPSTTNPVPNSNNAQQELLQKIATTNYTTMKSRMNDLESFKVSEFSTDFEIFQETTWGQTITALRVKTGFYVGPILIVDASGKTLYEEIVAISNKNCVVLSEECKDGTIIALDKINPDFVVKYPYFLPE